jgi:hypothetical protein
VETSTGAVFQWGKMEGVRALVAAHPLAQSAVVLLTNSNRGLRAMGAVVEPLGLNSISSWLGACVTE